MLKKIEFELPAGWQLPEGKKAGDRVEGVYELELKPNGMACLASLDDVPMPGYTDDDYDEDESQAKYKPGTKAPGNSYMEFPEG